ncbi:MAG: hypothetical protein GY757_28670, partial [bacterium]|nr:hypothetical protein [bacterium]
MSTKYFPQLKDFYQRFIEAVKESGQEQPFLKKWGLETLEDVYAILDNNIQGGYDSHKQSMTAAKTGGTVLTVGPGMGLCAFLLTEQFDNVYVAEPDGENCALLQTIAQKFTTSKNRPAENIMNTLHAGLSITQDAVDYWEAKVALMKERNMKGSILNFDIKGAAELKNTFHEKVARIYLHKVLSSLSIASTFE